MERYRVKFAMDFFDLLNHPNFNSNGLEGTDLTYAVSEFQAKQTALQAAQTMFAQTNKSNLFSLLG